MRRVMRRTAGLLAVLALLSACGTKGALYLPDQKAGQQKQQDNKQQPPRQ
jgi:predicted small lipoprotein YifL